MIENNAMLTLSRRLTAAFEAGAEETAPGRMENELRTLCASTRFDLPERFLQARAEGYARRLLFLDQQRRFSVLAMTWGPGQGTPLHDHDGRWGVECVIAGEMEAESFNRVEEAPDGRLRFESHGVERGRRGASGVLVPPLEYHLMRNPSAAAPAVTIHVYAGELTRCRVFHPLGSGWYRPEPKPLTCTE